VYIGAEIFEGHEIGRDLAASHDRLPQFDNGGVSPDAVDGQPVAGSNNPFVQNLFQRSPILFSRRASANYYYGIYGYYGGSYLDMFACGGPHSGTIQYAQPGTCAVDPRLLHVFSRRRAARCHMDETPRWRTTTP